MAEASDIVVTSLPSIDAFEEVVDGENGLVASGRDGLIVVESSTPPIETKLKAHKALDSVGITLLDCPLSGTGAQAITKDLVVYASGNPAAFDTCVPVFNGFSRSNHYVGQFGNGSKMKFVANLLVAIHNASAAEAFVLGMKSGLDPEMIYKVIGDGAGTSRMFEVRGPMMAKGAYDEATMKMDVWQKDMKIIGDFARQTQCPTPLFSSCAQVYTSAMAKGRAKQDTACICAVMEEWADLKRK